MPGWDTLRRLAEEEFTQSLEEGKPAAAVEALRPELSAAGGDRARLSAVMQRLQALPIDPAFGFIEPSDLEGIRQRRGSGPKCLAPSYGEEVLYDRMYGAWLGRCAGCALGKPVEAFMGPHNGLASWQRQKAYLTAIAPDEWPIRGYFPRRSPAEDKTGKAGCHPSTREHIAFMESDDDIRYTVIGQIVLREKGRNFTTADVMSTWLQHLPFRFVCTAETQAYRNAVARYEFHCGAGASGAADIDWHWVATHENPYREWIGAQIRADSYGYAAPGDPELAAEFAWRDARLSHVKNGIYGEMFVAAMIAAAFVLDEPLAIVEAGLAQIPQTSRLHREMRQTIDLCRRHDFRFDAFEQVIEGIYALLGHYHPVHTNNNAALVVAALLLGDRELEKTIGLAVMGGWDTDCNGATAGSILGACIGANALPEKWIAPLHDTLNSQIIDYHPIAISECARRSCRIALSIGPAVASDRKNT